MNDDLIWVYVTYVYICSMYKDRQVKELCYPEGVPKLFQVITYIYHIFRHYGVYELALFSKSFIDI